MKNNKGNAILRKRTIYTTYKLCSIFYLEYTGDKT